MHQAGEFRIARAAPALLYVFLQAMLGVMRRRQAELGRRLVTRGRTMAARDPAMAEYDEALGRLVSSLQTLELLMRLFLHSKGPAGGSSADLDALERALPGALVPLDAFTDYRSLGQLISACRNVRGGPVVDAAIVRLRDALAHGRVYAKSAGPPLHLLKFGKQQGGMVPIEYNESISLDWLARQQAFCDRQLQSVYDSLNAA